MKKTRILLTLSVCAVVGRLLISQETPVAAQTSVVPFTPERLAAYLDAKARHLNYMPGEVLVKFKDGRSLASARRALSVLRSQPAAEDLQWRGDVALLIDRSEPDSQAVAAQLAAQPDVEYAQVNHLNWLPAKRSGLTRSTVFSARPQATPNDTDFSSTQWNFTSIDMPRTWDINPGATSSTIVALIDTGVTTVGRTMTFPLWTGSSIQNVNLVVGVNPELTASRFVSPKDFVPLSGAPADAMFDMDGHGTHVADTINENTNNNLALAGIAYNAKLMPIKVCLSFWEMMIINAQGGHGGYLPLDAGTCPDDAIIAGIRYAADNHANVLNISLGGEGISPATLDALKYAVSKGTFISMSMGNSFDEGNPTNYPSAYAPQLNGGISVAAVGSTLSHAYYSGAGSYCEIAAPGGDDEVGGGGDSDGYIWQATISPTFYDRGFNPFVTIPRFDLYAEVGYEGTSMSAAHVSGIAALVSSQTKGKGTPAAIEEQLIRTAKDLGPKGKDDQYGYGLVQPRLAVLGSGIKK
jgi:serine protease